MHRCAAAAGAASWRVRSGVVAAAAVAAIGWATVPASAAPVPTLTFGDSLTAEYDDVELDATWSAVFGSVGIEYAQVTVDGWQSRSWVEILGELRPDHFDFGAYTNSATGHGLPRMSGYEYNWSVPGARASDFRRFVEASIGWPFDPTDALLVALRQEFNSDVQHAEWIVLWIGSNDIRENYGSLYDGANPAPLVSQIVGDTLAVLDYLRGRNPSARVLLVNLPDLGATPSRKEAHPDPVRRALAGQVIGQINQQLATAAAARGVALVDANDLTGRLLAGETFRLGSVALIDAAHPDNEPRHMFTRDGFHPNTCAQLFFARAVIDAFNGHHQAGIPQITDAEALALLGIEPAAPLAAWLAAHGLPPADWLDRGDDGLPLMLKFAFGLDPRVAATDGELQSLVVEGDGGVRFEFRPEPAHGGHVRVDARWSATLDEWQDVPAGWLQVLGDGTHVVTVPPVGHPRIFLRLRVRLVEEG